jgi:hypothetical protein
MNIALLKEQYEHKRSIAYDNTVFAAPIGEYLRDCYHVSDQYIKLLNSEIERLKNLGFDEIDRSEKFRQALIKIKNLPVRYVPMEVLIIIEAVLAPDDERLCGEMEKAT